MRRGGAKSKAASATRNITSVNMPGARSKIKRRIGIQYFTVETLDAADIETIRLLAEQVVPRVAGQNLRGSG
jgi:hypothetical protein